MFIFDKHFSNYIAMKQQEVFNKIGGILKELNDQFKYLDTDPEKINELELELFVANAHFLANHAEVLRKVNIRTNIAQKHEHKAAKSEEKHFEPFVHHPETEINEDDSPAPHIDIAAEAPTDEYSLLREEPEVIRHELEMDEDWLDYEEVEDDPAESEPKPEPEPERVDAIPEKSIAKKAEKIIEDSEILTINQKISAQLANKKETGLPAIGDLKAAITLNDKLLYVKELFNGYSLAYNETIDILNRFKTFEEADNYLKSNYAIKYDWESKPHVSEKFYGLLKRRYA